MPSTPFCLRCVMLLTRARSRPAEDGFLVMRTGKVCGQAQHTRLCTLSYPDPRLVDSWPGHQADFLKSARHIHPHTMHPYSFQSARRVHADTIHPFSFKAARRVHADTIHPYSFQSARRVHADTMHPFSFKAARRVHAHAMHPFSFKSARRMHPHTIHPYSL